MVEGSNINLYEPTRTTLQKLTIMEG